MLSFSVIPLPNSKREKEDLHRAGKASGQTKLTFAKKIIIETCYSLHCCNKLLCNVYQALLSRFVDICDVK